MPLGRISALSFSGHPSSGHADVDEKSTKVPDRVDAWREDIAGRCLFTLQGRVRNKSLLLLADEAGP